MANFTYKTELEVVTDLLADMERVQRRHIRRLDQDIKLGVGGPGQLRRIRVQIDLLEAQIVWYKKILATYAEAERVANEYADAGNNQSKLSGGGTTRG
jgi:hypothetical protein